LKLVAGWQWCHGLAATCSGRLSVRSRLQVGAMLSRPESECGFEARADATSLRARSCLARAAVCVGVQVVAMLKHEVLLWAVLTGVLNDVDAKLPGLDPLELFHRRRRLGWRR
jgi:hypothetical protein